MFLNDTSRFRLSPKFQKQGKSKTQNKWRLFHATDFQSLMFPCFTFCRMLGIFPYKINGFNGFDASKSRCILSSIVVGIFCFFIITHYYLINIVEKVQYDGIADSLEGHFFNALGGFIIIVTYILSGPRMRLLQTVMEVSSTLPPKTYHGLCRTLHAKDIIGFLFLFGQILNCGDNDIIKVMTKIFSLYIILITFQMDMLYVNCVCVLKACFQRINDNLINLRKLVVNNKSHLFSINHEHTNHEHSFLLMELKMLQKWHLKISDAVQMLNVIFSPQFLASTVMTFTEITFHLYFHLVQLREKISSIYLDKQIWYSPTAVAVMYYSTKFALIVRSCETGKNQALKIGTSVHDVLVSITDEQLKNELQLFSLQILHRDNAFSAKGVTVDARLLTTIVGSITTYLLILVQFLNAASICGGKSSSNVTQIFEVKNDN